MKTTFFSFLLMITCVFASAQKIKPPKKLEEFKKYIGLSPTNAVDLLEKGGFSADDDYEPGNFKETEYNNDDYDDILILTIGNKVEGAGSGTLEEDEYNTFLTELKNKGYKLTKEELHLSKNNDEWETDIWTSRDGKWKVYASRLESEMFRIIVATNKVSYGKLEKE